MAFEDYEPFKARFNALSQRQVSKNDEIRQYVAANANWLTYNQIVAHSKQTEL